MLIETSGGVRVQAQQNWQIAENISVFEIFKGYYER